MFVLRRAVGIHGRRDDGDVFESPIFPFATTVSFLCFTTRDPSFPGALSNVLRSSGDTSPPFSVLVFRGGGGEFLGLVIARIFPNE